jgi:hypothetical protein
MAERIYRISEEIKREISNIIQNDLKDPRLPEFVSYTLGPTSETSICLKPSEKA